MYLCAQSLSRLYLTRKAPGKEICDSLFGLQAQFANNPKYSLMIRSTDFSETAFLDDYVKTWSSRGTIHTVSKEQLVLHLSATGRANHYDERWGIHVADKQYWEPFILNCIKNGYISREALKEQCRLHGMDEPLLEAAFHGWGGLIQEMCHRGFIAYKNSTKKEFIALDSLQFLEKPAARAKVLATYFAAYGPATLQDAMYFTGYKRKEIEQLIANHDIPLESIRINSKEYFTLGKLDSSAEIPTVSILAGFDPFILGYKDKSRFLDERYARKYVTNTGIIHPAILIEGRLKGKWKKNARDIAVVPYERILKKHQHLLARQFRQIFKQKDLIVNFTD